MNIQPKSVIMIQKSASTVGETVTGVVDRLGFDFVTIDLITTTVAATTNRPTVLKLAESDITDSTGYTDITALVGDGTGGFTIPSWHTQTADAKAVKFNVDCRTRKRYLKLSVSVRTTQDLNAVANLFLPEIAPVTAAQQGALVTASA
jgi:hypothetical protein